MLRKKQRARIRTGLPMTQSCVRGFRAVAKRAMPLILVLACGMAFRSSPLQVLGVTVRYTEGLTHGFLVLRTMEGKLLAEGDLIQVVHGDRVTSQLVFHFRDGSVYDETVVFSQHRDFRLLTDHLLQKGPAFQHPVEAWIDGSTGQVKVHYAEDDGKQKVATDRLELPPDVANGLVLILLKNIRPDISQITLSMVAVTPKPRLVKLMITSQGEDPFSIGKSRRTARHYVAKVQIGGVAGLVAPLLGKQPPDTHVWILDGEAPIFVKSEGPLFLGGPIWRIELASPVWPGVAAADSKDETR